MEELTYDQLYRRCDPKSLDFETTDELQDIDEGLGQPRAMNALAFGLGMEHDSYNLYAMGPEGVGKRYLVERVLAGHVAGKPVPSDWCYVSNFKEAHRPRAMALPAGRGRELESDMQRFTRELTAALSAAFESEEYHSRRHMLESEFSEKPEKAFTALREHADEKGLVLLRTPIGVIFAPARDGEVLSSEEFGKLPDDDRQRIEKEIENMQAELRSVVERATKWERDRQSQLRALNREVTSRAVRALIEELRGKYAAVPKVIAYLGEVEQDVLENAREIVEKSSGQQPALPLPEELTGGFSLSKYHVNLFIDHSESKFVPVVFEDNPTFHNLVGRVEHRSSLGSLTTNFRLIRPGALHRANGGYLILPVRKLLMQPYAWEGLKRALVAREVRIESLAEALSLIATASLEPEKIPLDIKVILLGDRTLYYLLSSLDPEFDEIFKVVVDFDDSMDWTPETGHAYARLIATIARRESLAPVARCGVARVLEHAARLAEHSEKLSAHIAGLVDLLRESNYFAERAGRTAITEADVDSAIDARIFRCDRVRERMNEMMLRETVLVATQGKVIGQVNGLSALQLGGLRFGRPSRITVQVSFGKSNVVDIEREVALGGPLHSKGVLILASFVRGRYGAERPLAFSASIVFEQSYTGVEGDSASSAELYGLLSAVARIPLRQDLAITGSVDQHGTVQAIGGINEKIEGFFDLCAARGLTGEQGVIIPAANIEHLMLRRNVIDAVESGRFHVYPVSTIDQGIELLTGVPAGEREQATGVYPEGSINYLVEERLDAWAKQLSKLDPTNLNARDSVLQRALPS